MICISFIFERHVVVIKPLFEIVRPMYYSFLVAEIIWLNQPFSETVETNISREFRNILTRNFPVQHKHQKITNKNTVKCLTISCMPNIGNTVQCQCHMMHRSSISITLRHRKIQKNETVKTRINAHYITKSRIYQANISCDNDENFKYIGLVEGRGRFQKTVFY